MTFRTLGPWAVEKKYEQQFPSCPSCHSTTVGHCFYLCLPGAAGLSGAGVGAAARAAGLVTASADPKRSSVGAGGGGGRVRVMKL